MAYRAEIQIGVVGVGQLGALQKTLNQLSKTVDIINAKQIKSGFNIQNINTYNAQLEKAWRNINKAAMGSQEELQAVKALVQAKNNQIGAQERLNRLIEREELLQRKIVATANAGFGVQGPKQAPVPSAAKRGPASPIGGAKNIPGSPAALAGGQEAALNAILGGAFPALFGAGPGAILGGVAGGAVGGAMGGLGGMALSVAFSAVGQQLDQIIIKIRDIGNATQALDIDALRESAIFVNAELTKTVRTLTQAGKASEARSVIEKEIAKQTGLSAVAQRSASVELNRLINAWDNLYATVAGTTALLTTDFVKGLTGAVVLVQNIIKFVNQLIPALQKARDFFISLLPGANVLQFFTTLSKFAPAITEEEEKRKSVLEATLSNQQREIANTGKILDLEKQRTLGRTIVEKALNNQLDAAIERAGIEKRADDEKRKFLTENAGLEKASIERGIKNIEIIKQQEISQLNIKTSLQEQALAYEKLLLQQELQYINAEKVLIPIKAGALAIQQQQNVLEARASITSAYYQAENAVLSLQGQQLQREYELATSRERRIEISRKLFDNAVALAQAEYNQAITNINLDTQRLYLRMQLEQSKIHEIQLEAALQRLRVAAEPEELKRLAANERINTELVTALQNQQAVIDGVKTQIESQKQVAKYQKITADAQFKSKIITAQQKYEQNLVSEQIGLSKDKAVQMSNAASQSADNFKRVKLETDAHYRVQGAVTSAIEKSTTRTYDMSRAIDYNIRLTNQLAGSMARVGNNAIYAANAIKFLNNVRAAQPTKTKGGVALKPFATGGYVTGATPALIGEAGPEYVVPASKAANFAMNYALGMRGPNAVSATPAPAINIQTGPVMQQNGQTYVTMGDLEGAMQTVVNTLLGNGRTTGGRRYAGVS